MRHNSDAGSSVVIGFVIVLMLIALGIGIWALMTVPAEVKKAESTHALELQNAFLDLKLSMDKVRVNDLSRGTRFSILMPGSSGVSGTTIHFTNDTGGQLHIYNVTERPTGDIETDLVAEWWGGESQKKIGRLEAVVGGSRGTTAIGYEGGGVFRSDNGQSVWLTPELIQIYPDNESDNTIIVEIVVPLLLGDPANSGNRGVPVDVLYFDKRNDTKSFEKDDIQMRIAFRSDDPEQQDRWYSMFVEAEERYGIELAAWKDRNPGRYTDLTGNEVAAGYDPSRVTLTIDARGGKHVVVNIREATYNVSLVNLYENR